MTDAEFQFVNTCYTMMLEKNESRVWDFHIRKITNTTYTFQDLPNHWIEASYIFNYMKKNNLTTLWGMNLAFVDTTDSMRLEHYILRRTD